jgi:hypothetical protein
MYINLIDNIIELTCSKVDLSVNEEHGIQIVFEGQNDLDYFLVQRIYDWGNDEDNYVSVFYTEGCDTVGNWTFITATLESDYVQFSVDRLPIRIHLPKMTPELFGELRGTLELLSQNLGKFTDNSNQHKK